MFDPTSRYAALPTLSYAAGPDRTISYVPARILPQSATLTLLATTALMPGERLDLFANRTLGDPLLFWRIADANDAMDPDELVTGGQPLNVPLPTG
jgi:hypothetical protein